MERVRIIHPYDIFKGKIGWIVERIDQHSLVTYVVMFPGRNTKRAYQRHEIKFLKTPKTF
jgi:hypothetical protein